jgi:hypothetical protein
MKIAYKIVFLTGTLTTLPLPFIILSSCNSNKDQFDKYANIKDVLNLKKG